jgi:hypothetical protein
MKCGKGSPDSEMQYTLGEGECGWVLLCHCGVPKRLAHSSYEHIRHLPVIVRACPIWQPVSGGPAGMALPAGWKRPPAGACQASPHTPRFINDDLCFDYYVLRLQSH